MSPARRRRSLVWAGVALVVVLVGGRWAALETAERAWAATIAGGDVYLAARDLARLAEGVILLVSLTWGIGNLYGVYRAIGSVQLPRRLGDLEIVEAVPQRVLLGITLASGALYGGVLALGSGDWWLRALIAARPPHFGLDDPVLHRDAGYYVAALPWTLTCQSYALLATTSAVVLVGLLYAGMGSLRFRRFTPQASAHARLHLGALLACVALALAWGAATDPAEVVAGLHGPLDDAALEIRLPGATVVAVVAALTAAASAVWSLRERPTLLVASWTALVAVSFAAYLGVPALVRGGAAGDLAPRFAGDRRRLEAAAFGVEALEQRGPPPLPGPDAAVAALPLWDGARVGAVARHARLLGPDATVAGTALTPQRLRGGRVTWLVAPAPDLAALARTEPPPGWAVTHRGALARAGRPLAAVEADTALAVAPLVAADSAAWFGPGFATFAVAAPDTWPALRAAGIALRGRWRRTALAWALQSPELVRSETDGLVLLWRRDAAERLARLAPCATFESPLPVVADGTLWWIADGYFAAETFPLARPFSWQDRTMRYLRAGLVGAVSAATGDTRLYLAPGADSLARAWAAALAPLVRPIDSLPAAVRAQLHYPRAAFRAALAVAARAVADTAAWTAWPRDPFELVAPAPDAAADLGGGGGALWTGQGIETSAPPRFAALLGGSVAGGTPRLFLWRPPAASATALPGPVVGSQETAVGAARLWLVRGGAGLWSAQARFLQPASDAAPPRLERVYLSWGDRAGEGATPAEALRSLLAAPSAERGTAADTSLAARWDAARRLAARADSALAAGNLEAFGRLYRELSLLLRQLAPRARAR